MDTKPIVLAAIVVCLSVVAGVVCITYDGFWLDELGTHRLATASAGTWLLQFLAEESSDLQMPLYHLYTHAWSQLIGSGEWTLRLSNLPLYTFALAAVAFLLRDRRPLVFFVILSVGLHPLVWFYLNDARPYVMVYAATVVVMVSLWVLYFDADADPTTLGRNSAWMFFCPAIVLLAGSNMIAVFWLIPLLVTALVLVWSQRSSTAWQRGPLLALGFAGLALGFLAVFYLFSLLQGTRATEDYETSVATLLFAGYEVLGLGGLGPGRPQLRQLGISALDGFVPVLAATAIVIVSGVFIGLRSLTRHVGLRRVFLILVIVGLPVLVIAVVGFSMQWRVVGRHIMPVAGAIALTLGIGLTALVNSENRLRQSIAVVLLLSFGASAVGYSLPRHRSEDYRQSSEFVEQHLTAGKSAFWFASDYGAGLYGLTVLNIEKSVRDCSQVVTAGVVVATSRLHRDCVTSLKPPDVIVVSRPDTYDKDDVIPKLLADRAFTRVTGLRGFQAWKRVPSSSSAIENDEN